MGGSCTSIFFFFFFFFFQAAGASQLPLCAFSQRDSVWDHSRSPRSLKISISPPVRLDIEKKLVFRLCCSTMAEFGRWWEPERYCHRTLVREEPAARL